MSKYTEQQVRSLAKLYEGLGPGEMLIAYADLLAQAKAVPDGYRAISVTGFDALVQAIDRAESKGYLPDAFADEWAMFNWEELAAPSPQRVARSAQQQRNEATEQAEPFVPDYSEMTREALERHAARMAQLLNDDRPRLFHEKHAFGPMMMPSCLCCGNLPEEIAIKHAELPGVVICKRCRDAALQAEPVTAQGLTDEQIEAIAGASDQDVDIDTFPGLVAFARAIERAALAQREAHQPAKDGENVANRPDADTDLRQMLRQVFALCEATEDAPDIEPDNEHQKGFDAGRRFEAKQIRKTIGTWFQDNFCGRSFMGEPVLAQQPAKDAVVAWGLFAKVGGEWVLQHPIRFTEADAEYDKRYYKLGSELAVKPLRAAIDAARAGGAA